MKRLNVIFALVLSVFLIQSCQKDDINEPINDPYANQPAPELPAPESFIMPFDAFSGFTDEDANSRTINNWGHAAANVLVWNTLLTINLAIPTLSFYESFNHQAVYQGQGVWLWAYEVNDGGTIYEAKLYGELLVSSEVKWDMYISKVGGFQDVHWYTGITANNGAYSNWTLNFNGDNPTPFITINYVRENANGAESIRYTNVIPGNNGNGGYIEYREGDGAADGFDRAYDVFNIEIDNLLEANWDSINKSGRVKDANHFGDEDWHCWGTDLHDIDC